VLALLSAPVGAGDFRGLNFGDSCTSIPSREEARGSIAIPWKSPSGADISRIFKGREYDRDLTIMYLCSEGGLLGGNYFFQSEPLDVAVGSYRSMYDLFVSTYGAPFFDNTPWQVGGSIPDKRIINPDPREYQTMWKTARLLTKLNFAPNLPSEKAGWRVSIVVTRNTE
jgi:hypothetical protein